MFEKVAGDPACKLEVPGDATQEVPGGPRKHHEVQKSPGDPKRPQYAPRGPRRYQRVPRGSRRSQEALGAGPKRSQKLAEIQRKL